MTIRFLLTLCSHYTTVAGRVQRWSPGNLSKRALGSRGRGPTSRGIASAGPFVAARERGDEGGCGSPVGLQIRVWPPRGRKCVRPRGRTHPDFVDGRNPGPREIRGGMGRAVRNPRRVGSNRPSGSGRGQTRRAEEGRVACLAVRRPLTGSGLGSPFTSDKAGPQARRLRSDEPRHCLGRAVRWSARAWRRRGVRQSRRAPNPGVAGPAVIAECPPSGAGRIRISSTAEIRSTRSAGTAGVRKPETRGLRSALGGRARPARARAGSPLGSLAFMSADGGGAALC